MANITEAEIRKIVENIIKGAPTATRNYTSTEYAGRRLIGIYADMNEAIDAAEKGYKAVRAMTVEQRERIIAEMRKLTVEEAPIMAEMGVAETGMGFIVIALHVVRRIASRHRFPDALKLRNMVAVEVLLAHRFRLSGFDARFLIHNGRRCAF